MVAWSRRVTFEVLGIFCMLVIAVVVLKIYALGQHPSNINSVLAHLRFRELYPRLLESYIGHEERKDLWKWHF